MVVPFIFIAPPTPGRVNVPVMVVVILLPLTRAPLTSQSVVPLPSTCILMAISPPPVGPGTVASTRGGDDLLERGDLVARARR